MPRSTIRRRRFRGRPALTAAAMVATVAALVIPSISTASERLSLTAQPDVPFPVRVFVVSTPGAGRPSKVVVTENGRPVRASLTPVGRKRIPFSAALLLDSSLTMIGKPLVAARTAATTLIERKPPRSELAIYGFSAKPYQLHDWSSAKRSLISSLDGLRTRYGTAAWDSVILASTRLRARKGSAKAIVILTDGRRDTTRTRYRSAISAATRAGSRVFVVIAGRSDVAQKARLEALAERTGGAVLEVSSIGQLRSAFARIARTLSRQYLLSYASGLRADGQPVKVHVRVDGATANVSYTTPETLSAGSGSSFWFTTGGAIVLVAAVILIPLALVAWFSLSRRRDPRFRRY